MRYKENAIEELRLFYGIEHPTERQVALYILYDIVS